MAKANHDNETIDRVVAKRAAILELTQEQEGKMIYVTGDTHRDFSRIKQFCKEHNTTQDDIMIVLGDNGINYYGNDVDTWFKQSLCF